MFDLGFLNKYPYTDFHELNLDWIIRALKDYTAQLEAFVQINAIKYADPIQWDITRQYEKNTVVVDPLTGIAYISVAAVPAGISLSRPEYWTVIFDLSRFINAANDNFTVRVETGTTTTATFNTAAGEWLVWDQKLYRANVNITAGDAYVEGSNITRITAEEMLQEVQTALDALTAVIGDLNDLNTGDKSSIVNAINDVVSALTAVVNAVGDLSALTTTDKSSIVNAINEVVAALSSLTSVVNDLVSDVGDLNDLTTTDKTSIVNAINELVTSIAGVVSNIGDLADLTTTDQTSIVNAINEIVSNLSTVSGQIGDLTADVGDLNDLTTTDKTSIVNAINEINAGGPSRMISFVTPQMFGAVADGVTDDTTAVQDAIDAADKMGVFFPAGDYLISSLTIPDDMVLLGESGANLIQSSAALVFDLTSISNISITGLTFTNSMSSPTIFKMTGCDNVLMQDCHFIGNDQNTYSSNYIVDFETCSHVSLINCEAERAEAEGVLLNECVDCLVSGGSYHNMDNGSGILTGGQNTNNIIIDGAETYACSGSSININGPYCTVRNCYCHDNVSIGINLGHGTPGSASNYSKVVNNTVINSVTIGIQAQTTDHCQIVNNTVINLDAKGTESGVKYMASGDYGLVSGNTISNFTYGVVAGRSSCRIVSNDISNCDDGISMFNTQNAMIGHNEIRSCTAGIRLDSLGADNLITANRMTNCTSYGILDVAYDLITDNFISGSSTAISASNATLNNNILAKLSP